MAQVKFTAKLFANATASLISACNGVDLAINGTTKATQAWATLSVAGIDANSITLDDVKAAIIAGHNGAKSLADCGNTIKGRFYALQRIVNGKAGDRILKGEAFHTVARDCKPKQEQKGKSNTQGNGGKNSSKTVKVPEPKLIPLNTAIAAVQHHITVSMANGDTVRELAASTALSNLMQAMIALSQAAEKGVAKPAKNKVVRQTAPRKIASAKVTPMRKVA